MDDSLFNDLLKSIKEVKEHVEGKKKLKTTKANTVDRPNYKAEKIEEEDAIDLKLIEEYEEDIKNENTEVYSHDEVKKILD